MREEIGKVKFTCDKCRFSIVVERSLGTFPSITGTHRVQFVNPPIGWNKVWKEDGDGYEDVCDKCYVPGGKK